MKIKHSFQTQIWELYICTHYNCNSNAMKLMCYVHYLMRKQMKFVVSEKPNKWSLGILIENCFTIQNNKIATFNHEFDWLLRT